MKLSSERHARFHQRMDSLAPLRRQEFTVEIYQNQRRRAYAWHRKYLLQDDPLPFTNRDGTSSLPRFPKKLEPPLGYQWLDKWKPCTTQTLSDANGWTYAPSFEQIEQDASPRVRDVDAIRRRRWVRVLVCDLIPFKWKEDRLGIALAESVDYTKSKTIEITPSAELSLQFTPVGCNQDLTVKHVSKSDLHLYTMISRGDVLLSVDEQQACGLPLSDVMKRVSSSLNTCKLTFAPTTRQVHIQDCNRNAMKVGLRAGFILVGLNERSLRHVRLMDVESLLVMAPKHSCVLYFQAAVAFEPPFYSVAPFVVGLHDHVKTEEPRRLVATFAAKITGLFASSS